MTLATGDFRKAPMRREEVDGLLAWGQMFGADFSDKTITLRVEGDMPTIARGRYAIVDAERFRMILMRANAWSEQRKAGKSQ